MKVKRIATRLLPLTLSLAMAGCVGGATSPPSNFYLLEPIAGDNRASSGKQARLSVALHPVKVPEYLDRPQIVTATAPNAYQLSEFNRWAEALDVNITRVLAQNLTLLVPADVWSSRSSLDAKQAALRLRVDILEFHIDPKGQAKLVAQWRVKKHGQLLWNRQVSYRAEASKTDYRRMVAALNDCLNRLSRDIAQSLSRFVP
ncbi:PqiC family protein [Methylomarinum vadi]|uniref:PqiC family protein n=1 Tax=Methylomarinum vadi TaxID=438855 RepID=UPI0004DF6B22|nr:PqiC family protein [Methylomarinum vadi]